jgi:hypothetical protein
MFLLCKAKSEVQGKKPQYMTYRDLANPYMMYQNIYNCVVKYL